MHFVIVGCGAVGGYFGGRLAQHGENVTFVARGQQLNDMQSSGLSIKSIDGDVQLETVKVIDANSIEADNLSTPADVIFLCVKSYQLSTAIEQIKPLITPYTRVVPLLNGVNAVQLMQDMGIAKTHVYGGLAKIIAEKSADGVIHHTGAKPHITLGALTNESATEPTQQQILAEAAETKQLSEIAKRLKLSGISVGVTSDINLALWRKYIFVAAWGALASARKLNLGEIRSQSHLEFLLERIVNEYAEIARKLGINLADKHIRETLTFLSRLPESSETSMQRDIALGQESEFDILVAYPMALVKELGLSAPVLTQCYQKLVANMN